MPLRAPYVYLERQSIIFLLDLLFRDARLTSKSNVEPEGLDHIVEWHLRGLSADGEVEYRLSMIHSPARNVRCPLHSTYYVRQRP